MKNQTTPPVWPWYQGYCLLMALMYLLIGIGSLSLLLMIDPATFEEETWIFQIQMGIVAGLGFLLFIPFAMAPFLPKTPWVWIYHLFLIALGLTSVCCLPATIPLLIFWIKPETQQFFGRV